MRIGGVCGYLLGGIECENRNLFGEDLKITCTRSVRAIKFMRNFVSQSLICFKGSVLRAIYSWKLLETGQVKLNFGGAKSGDWGMGGGCL